MAAKSPKEAADNFVFFLRETLSCISDHYLSAFHQSEKLYKAFYEPYAKITGRDGIVYNLSVTQIFRTVPVPGSKGEFKAQTQEYSYRLLDETGNEDEFFAYHWHPLDPGVRYPHLHIKTAHRIHFQTSRVCLEDVILLLIRDYKIRPRLPHAEWREILSRNKKAFEKMASWKIHHQ